MAIQEPENTEDFVVSGTSELENKTDLRATHIRLFSFSTPQMRAFHLSWWAFFCCFFAWFAMAPLMAIIRREFQLTPAQVGDIIIASVAATIVSRLLVGWMCDRYGPRLAYTWLLALGSIPVMAIGLARDYHTYLLFRLAIGAVGASFVITQYHTSVMFAPRCVGTANATTAGWGNMGGGAAQLLMPLLFAACIGLGATEYWGWRLAMIVPGAAMLVTALAYFLLTQDTPTGSVIELRREGQAIAGRKASGSIVTAMMDRRVWALALIYGVSFGVEITIHNVAALHLIDRFHASLPLAGAIVGAFGLLAIFARTLGGLVSDRVAGRFGLSTRGLVLAIALLGQGAMLAIFSQAGNLPLAVLTLLLFGLCVHIACGATYALIPFINREALGSVSGIVGAGGNVGAVLTGLLFRGALRWPTALLIVGVIVVVTAMLALIVRFERPPARRESRAELEPAHLHAIGLVPT